jgi:hypothetical protein
LWHIVAAFGSGIWLSVRVSAVAASGMRCLLVSSRVILVAGWVWSFFSALSIYIFDQCAMGVLRDGAYKNKPSILLSIGAYLYRRGA